MKEYTSFILYEKLPRKLKKQFIKRYGRNRYRMMFSKNYEVRRKLLDQSIDKAIDSWKNFGLALENVGEAAQQSGKAFVDFRDAYDEFEQKHKNYSFYGNINILP